MTLSLEEIAPYLRAGGQPLADGFAARVRQLADAAPLAPRTAWAREDRCVYLCGTVGADFDAWQRRLAVLSAADGFIAQAIGTAAVEQVMDALEAQVRTELSAAGVLSPRRSPGYGALPLALSREILDRLDAPRRLGVTLTDSMLLVPSKSVTAVCTLAARA